MVESSSRSVSTHSSFSQRSTPVDKILDPDSDLPILFIDPGTDGDSDFLNSFVIFCCSLVDSRRLLDRPEEAECWNSTKCHSVDANTFGSNFTFIRRLATDCCLTRTSLIMGLHFFIRACSTKQLTQSDHTWRTILANCFILSEKMWEDNYIHPHYIRLRFTYHCGSRRIPTTEDFLKLQMSILAALEWRLNISKSQFDGLHDEILNVKHNQISFDSAPLPDRPLPTPPCMNILRN